MVRSRRSWSPRRNDEGDAEQPSHAEVDHGGRDEPDGAAVRGAQRYRLVGEAAGVELLDGHELVAVAPLLADVLLELAQEDLLHPDADAVLAIKEMHHGAGGDVDAGTGVGAPRRDWRIR